MNYLYMMWLRTTSLRSKETSKRSSKYEIKAINNPCDKDYEPRSYKINFHGRSDLVDIL